jgi:tetratricopeptide (TPR) repeat protein
VGERNLIGVSTAAFRTTSRTALIALLLGPSVAQSVVQSRFDDLYAKAEAVPAADAARRRAAFAAAYRAFARIKETSAAYRGAVARGAEAAFYAGAHRAAATLFGGIHSAGRGDDRTVTFLLISLQRSGQGRAAAGTARSAHTKYPGGVHDWLVDPRNFVGCAALGGELLQARDPLGMWLLQTQAHAMVGRAGEEFALANLALAYRHTGRGAESRAVYQKALKLAPRDGTLWSDYGLLLKGLGDRGAAFQAFTAALQTETEPGSSPAGTNLGVLFQRTGRRRGRDPRADLVGVLAKRPRQSLARRLLLDGLAGEVAAAGVRKPR